MKSLTARYVKTSTGYMGQIMEWPEVVTEGTDLEDCRESLRDALQEMVQAHKELGQDLPIQPALFEPLSIESA